MMRRLVLGALAASLLGCSSADSESATDATTGGNGTAGVGGSSVDATAASSSVAATGSTTGGGATTNAASGASASTGASSSSSGMPDPVDPVDLRADTNRDGVIDFATSDDDLGEDAWSADHGAVFLANLDDDALACPTSGTDAELAACHDAADDVVNGPDDLADLARLATRPWPAVPAGATGTIKLSAPGASYVRLFKKGPSGFSAFAPGAKLSSAELSAGVELALEGRDIVRDAAAWNGRVTATLEVTGAGADSGTDSVELRIAPALFRHHLDPASTYYVTKINSNSSLAFRNDLAEAAKVAQVPVRELALNDQWTQDFFETAYTAMPAVGGGGKHVLHLNFRSANYSNGKARAAGRVVFTDLRGKNVGGVHVYDPKHPDSMDTLNSFGNLETIPPYSFGGTSWPLGRVIRGSTGTFYADKAFDAMVNAQGAQDVFYVDTSWLLVAHVDETLSFIKAPSPRGWVMLVSDPAAAKKLFEQQKAAGNGGATVFSGLYWADNSLAQTTVNGVLSDTDVLNESAWAATELAEQLDLVKAETGLLDTELVSVPFLFQQASGYSVAYQPGTVNGISLSDTVFAAPKPNGPVVNGVDVFEAQLKQALSPYGVSAFFVRDWYLYHILDGEVHCGSNTTRAVPATTNWWESL
ncbi:MAG: protein-arginine deiminase [Deltaproteobacteria bacterium]|nr:protein-arginine deiminase [Deltaproteobacteria bacterium]